MTLPNGFPASILVVEDERIVAQDLKLTLEGLGYHVPALVATGLEALAEAARHRPQLALMDIHLAGDLDGVETARRLRRELGVPVVFLTGNADDATILRARQGEPLGFLIKPFHERELKSTLEVALHQHELERELGRRERWLATTLASIGDAVLTTDASGRITYLNPVAERLLRWSSAAAVGRTLDEVFRVQRPAAREPLSPSPPGETFLSPRTGEPIAIEDLAAPIVDDAGSLIGRVIVFRDVSERRTLQARMALAERMVAVGTLTAGIAHELNNPLSFVVGNVAVARDLVRELAAAPSLGVPRDKLDELNQALGDALQGAERVRRIVGDLRAFARPELHERRPIDVRPLLEGALRMTASELRRRARVETTLEAVPLVDADEARLGQVFVGLLINAAQALPDGNGEHRVTVRSFTDAEGRAIIEIGDDGVGIAPEHIARVFDPFFTTKPIGVGTGLGLSLCHSIVTELGGNIEVESTLGAGSLFRVRLPPAASRRAGAAQKRQPEAAVGRGRILVVDDEVLVVRTLLRVLKEHEIVGELDGQSALGRLQRGERFDLILCDLMMPLMSGMELYGAIRAIDVDQAERMVFVTGGAFSAEGKAFLDGVANLNLEKPVPNDKLRQLVVDILREKGHAGATA